MDALTTTILSGVVVAVIGAFATAYFAVRRERRAKQAALRERRVEALAEIQSRAYSVFVDLKGLTESIVRLREEKMPEGTAKASTWLTFFDAYAGLAQQRDDIAKEMQSLRAYYEMQTSYLETTSRNLFPSFDREFEQRYMPLSRHLYSAQTRRDHQQIDKMLNTSAVDWWFQDFYETLSWGF